jgi:hypothetical protein
LAVALALLLDTERTSGERWAIYAEAIAVLGLPVLGWGVAL